MKKNRNKGVESVPQVGSIFSLHGLNSQQARDKALDEMIKNHEIVHRLLLCQYLAVKNQFMFSYGHFEQALLLKNNIERRIQELTQEFKGELDDVFKNIILKMGSSLYCYEIVRIHRRWAAAIMSCANDELDRERSNCSLKLIDKWKEANLQHGGVIPVFFARLYFLDAMEPNDILEEKAMSNEPGCVPYQSIQEIEFF